MVEANEEVKIEAQPQDNSTTGADEELTFFIEALDKRYNINLINERVEALKKLK